MTNLSRSLCLLATLVVATTASAQPVSWFPLEAGATQEVRIHTDQTIDRTERPRVRTFTHEWSTIEAVPGSSPSWIELREARRLAGEAGNPGPIRTSSVFLRAAPWGIVQAPSRQAAEQDSAGAGEPLRMLPRSPRAGERWAVGTLRIGGLAADVEAEAVGVEDLTVGSATRSGCLHVSYRGEIAGEYAIDGERLEVDHGTWAADRWFCPDEGQVKAVLRTDVQLVLPDLNEIRVARIETQTRQP